MEFNAENLNADQRRRVASLKGPVTEAASAFGKVRASIKDLAPKVIGLYNQIKADLGVGFTFVMFCRLFDPTVPLAAADRDGVTGYRNHPVYYTLQYMQRQVNLRPRGRQGVRDLARASLERTLATLMQIIPNPAVVWEAVQKEFNFSDRMITRLQRNVADTKPIFELRAPRGGLTVGNVIHMEPQKPADEPQEIAAGNGEAAAARRPARRRQASANLLPGQLAAGGRGGQRQRIAV